MKIIQYYIKDTEFLLNFNSVDPNLTIERFVYSKKNLLAHKLICKIIHFDPISNKLIPSDLELASFNPIYLHGPSGTGKTHLLQAVYHALLAKDLKVIYITAERFTQHVVSAIRSGEMALFRNTYRNIDVLLVDDVHVLSKKGATQEEFFHTFNTLHLAGKQIILASTNSPQELQNIEPRLISRFEWGIVLPIDPLDEEGLSKALNEKLVALQVTLNLKVTEFLLATFTRCAKFLLQATETLIYRYSLRNDPKNFPNTSSITVNYAKKLLNDLIEEEKKHILTPTRIINKVAEHFGLVSDDIYKRSQKRECVVPRHLAIYFCRSRLGIPYKKIGDIFSKDHSTIMSSVKLVKKALESNDKEIASPYFAIVRKLHV